MNNFYFTMVDLGRMDLLEVPAHCRQQVAQMLGREDELNPPAPTVPDPITDPEEDTAPVEEENEDTESNEPEEGESPSKQD